MSTLKVNRLENTSSTDGGIDIDADGHVQFDGVQLPTAGALSHRNLVINGAMQVAQRNTSSSDNGYHTVDRWRATISAATGTQSQLSLTSGDPYDEGFRRAFRLEITSPSSDSGGYIQMRTHLEAQTIAQSGWKYTDSNQSLTCSFWVRSSLAGTYNVQYRANDSGNFFFNRAFTVTANTWTKVTQTIPGHSSLVFNNDTGDGLQIVIVPQYGTDHTDNSVSNNTWFTLASGSYFPDYAQSFLNTDNATFDVTGVQLEVGSKSTPFEHISYGEEVRNCQRYYTHSYNTFESVGANTASANPGVISSTAYVSISYASAGTAFFPVEMRGTPSITIYSYDGTAGKINADNTEGTGAAFRISTKSAYFARNNDDSGVGANVYIACHYAADAELY
tara:strand:- start:1442 stop:2614 length:1173 start_codon:yes stop_codon:yes gene_type:complete